MFLLLVEENEIISSRILLIFQGLDLHFGQGHLYFDISIFAAWDLFEKSLWVTINHQDRNWF